MPYSSDNVYVSGVYRHSSVDYDFREAVLVCTLPEAFTYALIDDIIEYEVGVECFLHDICHEVYADKFDDTLALVEAVAQFQPIPISDMSVPLSPGTQLLLPSYSALNDYMTGESLADTPRL